MLRTIVRATTVILVLVALVWGAAFALMMAFPETRGAVAALLNGPPKKDRLETQSSPDREMYDMQFDHMSVANWVMQCTGTVVPNSLPSHVRDMYPGYQFTEPVMSKATGQVIPDNPPGPNNLEREVIQLSFSLWTGRYSLRIKATETFGRWQFFAITTIIIGMLTTIFISLSATDALRQRSERFQTTIKFLAIVFPAIGTAFAGVTAFYGPQAEAAQASRTLTGLTNLHREMSISVWDLTCLRAATPPGDPSRNADRESTGADSTAAKQTPEAALREALKVWKSRYNGILAADGTSNDDSSRDKPTPKK